MYESLFPVGAVDGHLPTGVLRYRDYAKYVRDDDAECAVDTCALYEMNFPKRIGLVINNVVKPSFNPRSEHLVDLESLLAVFTQRLLVSRRALVWSVKETTPHGDELRFVRYPAGWHLRIALADLPRGGAVYLNASRLGNFLDKVEAIKLFGG